MCKRKRASSLDRVRGGRTVSCLVRRGARACWRVRGCARTHAGSRRAKRDLKTCELHGCNHCRRLKSSSASTNLAWRCSRVAGESSSGRDIKRLRPRNSSAPAMWASSPMPCVCAWGVGAFLPNGIEKDYGSSPCRPCSPGLLRIGLLWKRDLRFLQPTYHQSRQAWRAWGRASWPRAAVGARLAGATAVCGLNNPISELHADGGPRTRARGCIAAACVPSRR
jgi:hypothetical protein